MFKKTAGIQIHVRYIGNTLIYLQQDTHGNHPWCGFVPTVSDDDTVPGKFPGSECAFGDVWGSGLVIRMYQPSCPLRIGSALFWIRGSLIPQWSLLRVCSSFLAKLSDIHGCCN